MNSATQMRDVKTLLAPCLNWEAVLRSMFLLIGTSLWLPFLAQVTSRLKVLHELRSPVIDLCERKQVIRAADIGRVCVCVWLRTIPLQQFALVWL